MRNLIVLAGVVACSAGSPGARPTGPAPSGSGSAQPGAVETVIAAIDGSAAAPPSAAADPVVAAITRYRAVRQTGSSDDIVAAAADAVAAAHKLAPDVPLGFSIPEDDARAQLLPLLVSPDGTRWAVVTPERVGIHDAASGLMVASIAVATTDASVALLDHDRIAVADDRDVRLLDTTGATTGLRSHGGVAVVAGPHDALAVVDVRTIEVVSVAAGSPGVHRATVERPPGGQPATWARWHGTTLVVSDGKRVELWRVTADTIAAAATLPDYYASLALSWDGRSIAAAAGSNAIHVFDPVGTETAKLETKHSYETIRDLAFAGDALLALRDWGDPLGWFGGALVELGQIRIGRPTGWVELPGAIETGADGTLVVANGSATQLPSLAALPVDALAWSPHGDRLLAFGPGAVVELGASDVVSLPAQTTGVERVRFRAVPGGGPAHELWWIDTWFGAPTYYGYRYGLNADVHGRVKALDLDQPAGATRDLGGSSLFDLSRDGARVLVQPGDDKPLEIRDATTNKLVQQLHVRDPIDLSNPMATDRGGFTANERLLALGGGGHTVVWDLARSEVVWSKAEALVGVSPDARLVLTATPRGVRATDLANGRDLGVIPMVIGTAKTRDEAARDLAAIAFSPDGKLAAIGSQRGTLGIVELATWSVRRSFAVHDTEITTVAWRPDGKLIATGSRGGAIALVELDGTRRATLALGAVPRGDDAPSGDDGNPRQLGHPSWLALFPDGTARGPGRELAAVRVGGVTVGLGVAAPPPAPASAWQALFESP